MATWPENPRLISTNIPRIDGLAKASGRAKYPSDVKPAGLLFGVMLYSPYAHAKIKSIDTSKAESMPGVKAVVALKKADSELRYQGDDIAAVAAETEAQARDAVRAIKVDYQVLPHAVTEEQAMAEGAPEIVKGNGVVRNTRPGRANTTGTPDEALAKADASIDATYSVPVITHVCLETHGSTVQVEGSGDKPDKIVAWTSTQSVMAAANEFAQRFKVQMTDVTVHTDYMGGGFGSKFGAESWGLAAAELSQKAGGKPVRMFLDRIQEHVAAGNRPSATGHVRLGATKDGKITAMIAETHGTGGLGGGAGIQLPYVYNIPNRSYTHTDVFVNAGGARAMRAPRHPQSCLIMESAMDDLADKLGIDPLEFRLKNLGDRDMVAGGVNRTEVYQKEVELGAEAIGWKNRKPRGQGGGKGPVKRGMGMALHQWGGGGPPGNQVACIINPDGSVEVRSATQDIGTGARTVLAIIAAEVLGLNVTDIKSNIGNSTFPKGQGSGGSTTTPAMSPPTLDAVTQARDELFKLIAPSLGAEAGDLSLKDGKLLVKGEAKMAWKDACRKLDMMPVSVTGTYDPQKQPGLSANGVGGCQFADVSVDTETGVVKLNKLVAVQDSGLIIDMLTWKSQVYGGVIGGLNYGLFEERIMDPTTGVMLNPDMELYKLAGASDIPEIVVIPFDTPEMRKRGVIGVGEPPVIGTAAAIGNAVTNAIGVRVPVWPMNPMNVLNALATASTANGRHNS
ncbi:MAG TPA: xanthine dehydrogenase family protein molybdopterin-binding subunit [Isosphaeraceae bacterium]|jgi:xanthine dehydrogenase YagR molybdenum-binding subunit|nr:xanthine dehydrogenase family protein molybdopterin-binding subunit [Isosphaeraceae bacterium]